MQTTVNERGRIPIQPSFSFVFCACAVLVLLSVIFPVSASLNGTETLISSNVSADQAKPSLYGNYIVWVDRTRGDKGWEKEKTNDLKK